MFQRRTTMLALVASLALGVSACSDETTSPSLADGDTVTDLVASVSFNGTDAELRTGTLARPTPEGPAVTVNGHRTIVNGGTATLNVSSEEAFETLYVSGSAPISGLFAPTSGYFEIPMPVSSTTADVLFTFPQELPPGSFSLYLSAADAQGNLGEIDEVTFRSLFVGTGDVQVTVTWDQDSDVDLHVIDPAGQEIFWANRRSASGGELDLDSNAACIIDGVRNENITWAEGTAPSGMYTVRVDYWSSCDVSQTNYTVLVNNGGDIQIHHGTFTGSGDNGGAGSGTQITTFQRVEGPAALPISPEASAHLPVGPTSKW